MPKEEEAEQNQQHDEEVPTKEADEDEDDKEAAMSMTPDEPNMSAAATAATVAMVIVDEEGAKRGHVKDDDNCCDSCCDGWRDQWRFQRRRRPCTIRRLSLCALGMLCFVALLLLVVAIVFAAWNVSRYEISVPPLELEANVLSNVTSANGNESNDTLSVLIIGAGTAGLFTAYTLSYFGLDNYRILEASSDIGGRVQETTDFIDVPIDLGAEWIHGDPKVLKDLLLYDDDQTNVTETVQTISYQPQTWSVYTRGKRRRRDWFRFYYREFKFYNRTWYSYLRDYVSSRIDSDKIRYNRTVAAINYTESNNAESNSGSPIRVSTRDGRNFLADKVVVAVPLAVLDDITFTPPLPTSKRDAVDSVYVAPGIKAWIEFTKRFYADVVCTSSWFGFNSEGGGNADPVLFNAVYGKPSTRNALAYFNVGTDAETLVNQTDDDIFETIMAQLDTILDGQATKYYKQHYIQNWATVPHIQGAYSDDWNEDDASFDEIIAELARPVNGKLYFCGEHTEATEVATVHGAALSGRRAAQEVANDLLQESI